MKTAEDRREYQHEYYLHNKAKKVAAAKKWRMENPDRFRELHRKCVLKHIEDRKKTWAIWRKNNPDKLRSYRAKQVKNGTMARACRKYRAAHPEETKRRSEIWRLKNLHRCCFYSAKYRADRLKATPPWADLGLIDKVYQEANQVTKATGIPHHVDHIWPLRGVGYRGLHVHWNLRVISGSENCRKHNKRPI